MTRDTRLVPKAMPSNLLEESGLPLAYPIAPGAPQIPSLPDLGGFDTAARTAVRSLSVMQKEAIVARTGSPVAWRLSSDEGPYLQGHDFAPAPLALMTTGLAVDVLVNVEGAMRAAGIAPDSLRLGLDTRFAMEGSLPRRTMVGSALAPEIEVSSGHHDRGAVSAAVLTGVLATPTIGLLGPELRSRFTLTSHGRQIPVGRVSALQEAPPPAPITESAPSAGNGETIIEKIYDVGERTADAGGSLRQEQRRELHLHASVSRRNDGVAMIDVALHRPTGSTFRFLSDEPKGLGGGGRAPDAITYVSAGIGFCFMTQFGRYAKILGRELGSYSIVQDTRFSRGDPHAEPAVGGRADEVRTHVYLAPNGDDDFARDALDMSEQTCFIHALCRSELRPKVRVSSHGSRVTSPGP